jgi:hypothetical protein
MCQMKFPWSCTWSFWSYVFHDVSVQSRVAVKAILVYTLDAFDRASIRNCATDSCFLFYPSDVCVRVPVCVSVG